MRAQIQKWGNSLALRIPKSFAVESGIEQGSEVRLSLRRGKLVVAPVHPRRLRLEHLLQGVTKDNLHSEVDTGSPVGRESW